MKCHEARKLLPSLLEGELADDQHSIVAQHVQSCLRCATELAAWEQLYVAAGRLDPAEPPEAIEPDLEGAPDVDTASNTVPMDRPASPPWMPREKLHVRLLLVAVSLLIAAGITWVAVEVQRVPMQYQELAAEFDQYLQKFAVNPKAAQNALLAKYDSQSVNVVEATRQLGYRPTVTKGLPQGYLLQSLHLLEMPCGRCVQAICRREDGKVFAIFEHDTKQLIQFGNGSTANIQCNGCSCSLAKVDPAIAFSWKSDERQLTVVGEGDLGTIAKFVTHFGSEP